MTNLINDSIQLSSYTLKVTEKHSNFENNFWLWIAIIQLLIIIYLLFSKKKNKTFSAKDQFIKDAKDKEVDFGNIINSSFHVKPLYDELKIKCHPDNFPIDINKNKIALELFQEISKNRTDYKKLTELKEIAIQKLNIKN